MYSVIGSKDGRVQVSALDELLPADVRGRVLEEFGSIAALVDKNRHIFNVVVGPETPAPFTTTPPLG